MKKIIIHIFCLIFLSGFPNPVLAAGPELDADNNGAQDIPWGGTNSKTAAGARANLGLQIGLDVQPYNANTDTNKTDDLTKTGTQEISGMPEKSSPASGDVIIVEDSAAGYAKKKVQIGNLPASSATGDMEKATYDINDDGIIDAAALGTGTPDNTKFLRDDHTWQTIIDTGDEPASSDPDISTAGVIGRDTNDHAQRGYDEANQYVYSQKKRIFTWTITDPLYLTEKDNLILWANRTGFTFTITGIYSYSEIDDVNYTLRELSDMHNFTSGNYIIEAINITTDGTGVYYSEVTSGIDDPLIEDGHAIAFDNDGTDAPDSITIVIEGWLNGDVN